MDKRDDSASLLERARSDLAGMGRGDADAADRMRALVPDVQRRADAGDVEFQELLGGLALEYIKDYPAAYHYLSSAAEAGHPGAQRGLGYMLVEGLGVPKDEARAIRLFEAAAARGDRAAKFNLAGFLLREAGAPESRARAVRLLEEASAAGLGVASLRLGETMFSEGDFVASRRLLGRAVAQGSYDALLNLGIMCRDGLGGGTDRERALSCFLKLLDVNNGDGIHESHDVVALMSDRQIRAAALRAGRVAEGEGMIAGRRRRNARRPDA
ncbi:MULTISPECIES: tetratricopeptide repeat protein [unclassified Streptomyces]|uniref:tetratricopeptide repeat protein n=1 Tax=unclassified Streptomyces TaxID=2593676 RepID=UPI001314A5A4|nr:MULTISPECIES: tetratricopeptide repeat protein [unclassified Streptomyces]